MAVTLEIQRASFGRLVLDGADAVARQFFEEDISSVDPKYESYDERAARGSPAAYEEADTTAIRRGMGLGRAPHRLWTWVQEEAPVHLLAPLPLSLDLVEADTKDFERSRPLIEAALAGFIAQRSGEWRRLAVATKIIALKRPRLVPILDNYVLSVLGLHLSGDEGHSAQVDHGMEAVEVLRREGRRNHAGLQEIQGLLAADGRQRSKLRILDCVLWKAY